MDDDRGAGSLPTEEEGLRVLGRRIRVALGHEPGDLLLTGGRVVDVFTGREGPAEVVIADGRVAGVGPYRWTAERTIALEGRTVIPGLIDAHMHLESTLLIPPELSRLIVPHGTTAVISDSHEIGNVLGIPGIDMLAEAGAGLPLDLFFMASSCVPATRWEDAGASLGPAEVGELLTRPHVLGLAEVMDVPAVLRAEAERPRQDPGGEPGAGRGRRPRAGDVGARTGRLRGGRHPLRPRIDDRRRGPRQGRARHARPGPRGLQRPEPRRDFTPAGRRRARRLVVPGHRRHLPRRPAPARPP